MSFSSIHIKGICYAINMISLLVLTFITQLVYCLSSSVQSFSRVEIFATPWTAALQTSLFITNSQSLPKHMSIESVMPSNHLISVIPFSSCLHSFPASGSFTMSQFFTSGGQNFGVSASTSVLPVTFQD